MEGRRRAAQTDAQARTRGRPTHARARDWAAKSKPSLNLPHASRPLVVAGRWKFAQRDRQMDDVMAEAATSRWPTPKEATEEDQDGLSARSGRRLVAGHGHGV